MGQAKAPIERKDTHLKVELKVVAKGYEVCDVLQLGLDRKLESLRYRQTTFSSPAVDYILASCTDHHIQRGELLRA